VRLTGGGKIELCGVEGTLPWSLWAKLNRGFVVVGSKTCRGGPAERENRFEKRGNERADDFQQTPFKKVGSS